MRDLVNVDFPDADKIRVVRDNLSTHTPGPLSTRRSPRPRPIASSAGWSSTSRRSTPAGSTWPRSKSARSEEHTSELQSLMRISYAVFCLKKKKHNSNNNKPYRDQTTRQHDPRHTEIVIP